uniref:Uncharacterized protein n=1 Tax=Arundo donax TaxID=35708 RepID=A0A0A9HBT0_ARUDO
MSLQTLCFSSKLRNWQRLINISKMISIHGKKINNYLYSLMKKQKTS